MLSRVYVDFIVWFLFLICYSFYVGINLFIWGIVKFYYFRKCENKEEVRMVFEEVLFKDGLI